MKSDKKTRENYVGHSLHTSSVPSFNDPKPNPMWYLKDDAPHDEAAAELQRLKALEHDMMLEALGLKPKGSTSAAVTKRPLKPHELGDALKRTAPADADAGAAAGVGANSGTRGLALGAFGAPESIAAVDLPPEHLERVEAAKRRDSATVRSSKTAATATSSAARKSKKGRHSRRRRRRHDSDSGSSKSSGSSSSSRPRRRRRRRHDSDSRSSSSSSSRRSRSRSRSPRRRH